MLAKICHEAFESLNFPLASILSIRVDELSTDRFHVEGKEQAYILTVVTTNPTMLRGDRLPYKGSYKERVEAIVQDHLNRTNRRATAHIEITGPAGSIDGMISLQALVQSGKATANSPLVRTASTYSIPGALIRGRHLIGPSPAIAALIRRLVRKSRVTTVLDLFAGTGVAAKVVCAEAAPTSVDVVELDPLKIEFLRGHLSAATVALFQRDALSYPIDRQYDLVVADPYYDMVMDFLDAQGVNIRTNARHLLLASGAVEDLAWNRVVRDRLTGLGFRVRRHADFGQVIFECSVQ